MIQCPSLGANDAVLDYSGVRIFVGTPEEVEKWLRNFYRCMDYYDLVMSRNTVVREETLETVSVSNYLENARRMTLLKLVADEVTVDQIMKIFRDGA